jgi:hypothetical protein
MPFYAAFMSDWLKFNQPDIPFKINNMAQGTKNCPAHLDSRGRNFVSATNL